METDRSSSTPNLDQPPPSSLGDPIDESSVETASPIDDTLVTKVRCPKCTTGASWKGALTDEMLERTFTNGLDSDTGLPNCPRCGAVMELQAVEDLEHPETPIEQAARALPDRAESPRQPRIPGLTVPFNFEAATRSILKQRRSVRRAEAIAESKHKDASRAKKAAVEEQEKLSKLEDEFDDRIQDLEGEAERRANGQRPLCIFERTTGVPCTICASSVAARVDGSRHEHLAAAALTSELAGELKAIDLQKVIAAVAALELDEQALTEWDDTERRAVLEWLNDPSTTAPKILGRPHVVSEIAGQCEACGTLLTPLAMLRGLEAWPVGQLVGTDCPGAKKEPARRPAKRHASKETRQKAIQAAGRSAKALAAPRTHAGRKGAQKAGMARRKGSRR